MILKNPKSLSIIASLVLVSLQGCKTAPRVDDAVHQEMAAAAQQTMHSQRVSTNAVPDAVTQDLLSGFSEPSLEAVLKDEPRFQIAAENVDIKAFFSGLVKDTPYSIMLHPDIQGTLSIDLKDVTLPMVFDVVSSMHNLDIRKIGKIYQVFPAQVKTVSLPLNYLMMKRNGSSTMSVNAGGVSQFGGSNGGQGGQGGQGGFGQSGGNQGFGNSGGQQGGQGQLGQQSNGSSIQTQTETDFWKELEDTLKLVVGGSGGPDEQPNVVVSPQSGLVTVKGMPSEIAAVKDFLAQTEQNLQRQVVLEAKIIEVSLNDDFQQGINWQNALAHAGSTDFVFKTTGGAVGDAISATLGGVTGITFRNKDFNGVVNLLQTQGNVQVLSSPRVTATNNQKAVIKVGQDEYFVTDVSNTTVTGTATTTTPEISLTPFFSGIALDVTPQIDANNSVILHVHPSVSETSEQQKVITLNEEQFVLPLAQSNIRETDTVIKAQSGEIVVIGGLMQTVTSDAESKTPLLGDIPILGNLFKNKSEKEKKKELVILIKPTVVGAGTWQEQLKRSSKLLNQWYQE